MRHRVQCLIILALALASLAGCNSQRGQSSQADRRAEEARESIAAEATPSEDGVRRITIKEARAALEKNEAVMVDVRGSVEYKLGHIKGALSVPLGLIVQQSNELPRDKLIITYCA
ncbi:MAG TPA: rhodanese-like domain-containing protein [Pyrinomonadaceae bacterium]|nr:rhodanese-like domain-containing protein [Pyrinomonadaceae bacterium]